MQAYCVKCRAKRVMLNARAITMKNGKPATQGVCPVCGTKMFRIGRSKVRVIGEPTPEHKLRELKTALNVPQDTQIPINVKRAALAGYYGATIRKIAEEAMVPGSQHKRRTKYPEPEKLLYR
ncbi:hypothetical protein ES703_11519 [subsurface metagenome]